MALYFVLFIFILMDSEYLLRSVDTYLDVFLSNSVIPNLNYLSLAGGHPARARTRALAAKLK